MKKIADVMDRRVLLGTLAGSVFAAPLASLAQQARVARVGYLNLFSIPSLLEALRQGLQDHGWREGQNLVLEARSADGRQDRIPEIAAELKRWTDERSSVSLRASSPRRSPPWRSKRTKSTDLAGWGPTPRFSVASGWLNIPQSVLLRADQLIE
jgi:hypothetical protein